MPQGGIGHAEVEINGAALMLADALPPEYPPTSSLIHLYVPDCDAVYAQAMAAGATSVAEPADQFYGDRLGRITDPYNNQWSIAARTLGQIAKATTRVPPSDAGYTGLSRSATKSCGERTAIPRNGCNDSSH